MWWDRYDAVLNAKLDDKSDCLTSVVRLDLLARINDGLEHSILLLHTTDCYPLTMCSRTTVLLGYFLGHSKPINVDSDSFDRQLIVMGKGDHNHPPIPPILPTYHTPSLQYPPPTLRPDHGSPRGHTATGEGTTAGRGNTPARPLEAVARDSVTPQSRAARESTNFIPGANGTATTPAQSEPHHILFELMRFLTNYLLFIQ